MKKYIKYNNIEVAYKDNLHGGGIRFGQQFIPVVKERFGHIGHVFEFCAGPGFIGFSLLANNLCDKLTVADVNPEAVKVLNETIKRNGLESKVTVYLSDCLDNIPETEKWDLVVGNPPHVFCATKDEYKKDITLFDPNFNIHKKFYRDIHKFLKPTGSVLLQEHAESTSIADFKEMIEKNGLKIIDVFTCIPPLASGSKKNNIGFNLPTFRKITNPFKAYRAVKRRLWPNKPRNYYFIHAKIV
ncbi:MAG: methyltransferase [Candidatus Yanofskybacteria bacterium]|nr:methyltransferase [Candidatus Yanofskybacteria bacterium]